MKSRKTTGKALRRKINGLLCIIMAGTLLGGCSLQIGSREVALFNSASDSSTDRNSSADDTLAEEAEETIPDFEIHGLQCNVKDDTEYSYVTMTKEDSSKTTVGKASFTNHLIFSSDAAHPAKENYEWHTIDLTVLFSDENALENGFSVGLSFEDYYNCTLFDNSSNWDETGHNHFTVIDNKTEYSSCELYYDSEVSDWTSEDTCTFRATIHVLLPVHYSGFVIALYNKRLEWPEGSSIYDIADKDTLFYRIVTPADPS